MSPATARIASADRRASAQQDPQRIQATRGSSDNDHVPALCHARALPSFASFTPPAGPAPTTVLRSRPLSKSFARAQPQHSTVPGRLVAETSFRLAGTLERNDLTREQGRQTLASARAAREHVTRSR